MRKIIPVAESSTSNLRLSKQSEIKLPKSNLSKGLKDEFACILDVEIDKIKGGKEKWLKKSYQWIV